MSKKIKFLKRIALFLCILMLSANCASDDNLEKQGGNSNAKLKETQKWFNKYESDGENYFLLNNLQYNWDEAKITNSEDGTETTIVPIIESKKDSREFWEQRLYIYKTGKEDYKALVYEIATNKYVPLSSQSIDGGEFTGFISVWDLKTGFVRAARFENNKVIETGVVEVIGFTKRNTTNKAPIEAPCVYADFGDGGCGGKGGSDNSTPNLPGTVLREVAVNAPSTGSPVEYYGPRSPVIGGSTTGGYTSPGGGANSGGGGITAPTSEAIAAAIQKQIYADKLPACLKKILDDLVNTNAGPGNMINKFSGNDPSFDYNWTMETGSNNYGVSGNTLTSTYNITTGIISTFDIKQFPDATELSWAKTMLHESVHAYLITYFNRNEPGFKADYPVLFQRYMETKLWNSNHHEEIAQSIIQCFGEALESYGISKGYTLNKQFYQDMAWGGLENTNAFKNLPLADQRRISSTIGIELTGEDYLGNKKPQKGKKTGC